MSSRVQCAPIPGANELMSPEFQNYLLVLHDEFAGRIHELREKRAQVLKRALHDGVGPAHLPPSDATTGDWTVPEVPEELYEPGIEISGPASVTGMFINALNPGPGDSAPRATWTTTRTRPATAWWTPCRRRRTEKGPWSAP